MRRQLLTGLSACLLGALSAAGATGCVERRFFIRSDPPEVEVFLDGEPQGQTPKDGGLRIAFTHYGTREIVFRAPLEKRKAPLRMVVDVDPPWWQITPFDFVTELLIPWTIVDERAIEGRLAPAPPVGEGEAAKLIERATERRGLR